ncbi:MAG: ribokinase [Clostridia bacterium]|nr:ribokinase [Clostridia bacterium]
MKRRIGVVGSINTDLVCQSDTLPKVGETVTGTNFVIVNGGKGANEAVACARLGASTNLLACVGDDMFSRNAIANLQQEGVHITAVKQIKGMMGGVANIVVSNKNNQIIVVPGANAKLDVKYVKKYSDRIKECYIVGGQFETPIDSLLEVSRICRDNGVMFVLNPSPIKDYPTELYDNATYVIVNEIELKTITGYDDNDPYKVLRNNPNKLILTKGGEGCFYFNGTDIVNVPAIKVDVVDTTGAGDTFLGSYMVGLTNNMTQYDAIRFANICAGLKTTKLGAQTGMPTKDEVLKYIRKNKIKINLGDYANE